MIQEFGGLQSRQLVASDNAQQRFIDDTKHLHDIRVLFLTEEFCKKPNVPHRPIRIGHAHWAIQEVDCARAAAVVQAILRARDGVQLSVHAEPVLSCPFEREEDVVPSGLGEERLTGPGLDSPVRDRETHPVETCTCDFRKVLLSL